MESASPAVSQASSGEPRRRAQQSSSPRQATTGSDSVSRASAVLRPISDGGNRHHPVRQQQNRTLEGRSRSAARTKVVVHARTSVGPGSTSSSAVSQATDDGDVEHEQEQPGQEQRPHQIKVAERNLMHLAAEMGSVTRLQQFVEQVGRDEACRAHLERPGDAQLGNRPLHLAAWHGHDAVVAALLDLGAAVDAPNYSGDSALVLAVKKRHATTAQLLVATGGASALLRGTQGRCALHWAAALGLGDQDGLYERLLGHQDCMVALKMADTTPAGHSPFHLACGGNHLGLVKLMVGLQPDLIELGNSRGDLGLHVAAAEGNLAVVEWLIDEAGAALDARGRLGKTPLHSAAEAGRVKVVESLLARDEKRRRAREEEAEASAAALPQETGHHYHQSRYHHNHQQQQQQHEELVASSLTSEAAVKAAGRRLMEPLLLTVEDEIGGTALHVAAMRGQRACVRFLLGRGAERRQVTERDGMQAVHVAAAFGQTAVVEDLLDGEVAASSRHNIRDFVDMRSRSGRSPLMIAAAHGQLHTIEFLCRSQADLECRDTATGATALHMSSWFGQVAVIEYLLKMGADKNSKDLMGDSPLHWAVLGRQPKAVAFLLSRGAQTGAKDDRIGRTALHDAASKGYCDVVKVLLARADIEAVDEENGATALHLASWFGQLKCMTILLDSRAKLETRDRSNCTPLHWAVINKQLEAVRLLLERGAQLDAKGGKFDRTPLHIAAEWGYIDIAHLLMTQGAYIDLVDKQHCEPLHLAAMFSHPEMVKLLLQVDADPMAKNVHGFNSLHLAVRSGNHASLTDIRAWKESQIKAKTGVAGQSSLEEAVNQGRWTMTEDLIRAQALQQSGGTARHMDSSSRRQRDTILHLLDHAPQLLHDKTSKLGRSALHMAAQAGQLVATETLLERGAEPTERDKIGKTPLRLAFDNSKFDIVRLFVKLGISA